MENIDKILDSLAARFGTTAEHVWVVLVNQNFYEGVSCCTACIFSVIGMLFFARIIKKGLKQNEDYNGDLIAMSCVVCLACFVMMICFGFLGFHKLLNPEYYAMQEIFELIK